MTLDPATLRAILVMAAATIATRITGLIFYRFVTLGPRQTRAMQAIPPAVLMAVIAPTALATGPAESLAAAITAVAATRLPLLMSVCLGIVTVAGMRYFPYL
jgi:uncharacterized membrane protein